MIIAKVSNPDIRDRFFNLKPGLCRIGSALTNTVVLLDDGILPFHAVLHVGNASVEVELSEGAVGMFLDMQKERRVPLPSEQRVSWHAGDVLCIGNAQMQLGGLTAVSHKPESLTATPKTSVRPMRPLLWLLAVAIMITTGLRLSSNAKTSDDSGSPKHAKVMKGSPVQPPPQTTLNPVPDDLAGVRRKLAAAGITATDLRLQRGRWMAVVRVADEGQLQAIRSLLVQLDFPFEPEIHVDSQLRRAAEFVLSNVPAMPKIQSLHNGVLVLSAAGNTAKALDAISAGLRRDIPGIARVEFDRSTQVDLVEVKSSIRAIWAGRFPYLVLANNSIIRRGEPLRPGVAFVNAEPGAIVVEINGRQERMRFP